VLRYRAQFCIFYFYEGVIPDKLCDLFLNYRMMIFQLQTFIARRSKLKAVRQRWVHVWKKTVVACRGVDLLSQDLKTLKTRQAISICRKIEARSRFLCCRGKATRITYSECVSIALVIQHAKCIRCIVIWPVWFCNNFPHYLTTVRFSKQKRNVIEQKSEFRFSLQFLSETLLIVRRNERDMIINFHRYSRKVPVVRVRS
jgi:hypothetical protein